MTVSNHSTLDSSITTKINDNTSRDVTPQDVRETFEDLNDTFNQIAEADVSSSGTVNLTTLGSNFARITITGTAGITGFSAANTAGVVRIVEFSGILTLTHSATLFLPNAASNITTAAGDQATFYYDGSGWICSSYTRADGTPLVGGGGTPEGTAVLSTGEVGGTKFLREDGDGTCSWQTVAGGGDVTKVGTPVDNQVGIWTGDGTIEGDVDLTFTGTRLRVGPSTASNINMDKNDIQADNNGTPSTLFLNILGGGVNARSATASDATLTLKTTDDGTTKHLLDLRSSANSIIASIGGTGIITGQTIEATADTASGDNAAMGYTATEGLILTGQGSTNDVTIKNDADGTVINIPTGTTLTEIASGIKFTERADHEGTPAAGKAELWVKSTTPNTLVFTDDAGTDTTLGSGGGTPEGTAILSTGETGGTKFLREDGDGTCSWQTASGGGATPPTATVQWDLGSNTTPLVSKVGGTTLTETGSPITNSRTECGLKGALCASGDYFGLTSAAATTAGMKDDTFTVIARIFIDTLSTNSNCICSENDYEIYLAVDKDTTLANAATLYSYYADQSGDSLLDRGARYYEGSWAVLAWQVDGDQINHWVNGHHVASKTMSGTISRAAAAKDFRIGSISNDSTLNLAGLIKEFAWFDYALTHDEVFAYTDSIQAMTQD